MRYCVAKNKAMTEEKSYRIYVTDILWFYAKIHGEGCKRYYDIISGNEPENTETAAQTAKDKVFNEYKRLRGEI